MFTSLQNLHLRFPIEIQKFQIDNIRCLSLENKGKARRSREAEMISDLGNMDVMNGHYEKKERTVSWDTQLGGFKAPVMML